MQAESVGHVGVRSHVAAVFICADRFCLPSCLSCAGAVFVLQAEIEKVQKRREEREAEKERMEEELVSGSF